MHGQFVRPRPSIDRSALDLLPVAVREHTGSSAISAGDSSFWHGPNIPARQTRRPGVCRLAVPVDADAGERAQAEKASGDLQPAMVPGGSQLSGTLPATRVPVSVTVPSWLTMPPADPDAELPVTLLPLMVSTPLPPVGGIPKLALAMPPPTPAVPELSLGAGVAGHPAADDRHRAVVADACAHPAGGRVVVDRAAPEDGQAAVGDTVGRALTPRFRPRCCDPPDCR